jgi:nitrous oxide reductase family maturation protein NosD
MRRLTSILAAMLLVGASASGQEMHAPAPGTAAAAPAMLGEIGRRIAAARDGDTIEVGPGTYREHVRIDKSVKLVGVGRPVLDGAGSGDIVEISAPGVELRGFTIRDTGIDLEKENAAVRVTAARATVEDCVLEDVLFGIDLREAPGCVIRANHIGGKALDIARRGDGLRLWRSDGTLIEGNTIHDGRDAILWYSQNVTVRGNTSERCRYGFHLMYSDSVTIEDNTLNGNSVGVYLMYSKVVSLARNHITRNRGPSGYGIGLKEVDQFTVENNVIAGNRVGVYLDGSPFTTAKPGEFFRNTIACNDIGMTFLPSVRGNQIFENNFIDNIEQVCVSGRGELRGNQFSKDERGNFWTDYVGYDQDHDGVGDFVHESQTLFENMMDREPKLRILLFSPAQQAIELVGKALPAVRPEPKFTDECPLMAPVITDAGAVVSRSGAALGLAAASLVGVGALVLAAARVRIGGAA